LLSIDKIEFQPEAIIFYIIKDLFRQWRKRSGVLDGVEAVTHLELRPILAVQLDPAQAPVRHDLEEDTGLLRADKEGVPHDVEMPVIDQPRLDPGQVSSHRRGTGIVGYLLEDGGAPPGMIGLRGRKLVPSFSGVGSGEKLPFGGSGGAPLPGTGRLPHSHHIRDHPAAGRPIP